MQSARAHTWHSLPQKDLFLHPEHCLSATPGAVPSAPQTQQQGPGASGWIGPAGSTGRSTPQVKGDMRGRESRGQTAAGKGFAAKRGRACQQRLQFDAWCHCKMMMRAAWASLPDHSQARSSMNQVLSTLRLRIHAPFLLRLEGVGHEAHHILAAARCPTHPGF